MLQVMQCRSFTGKDPQKKSFGKTFYVCDLIDTETSQIAVDVFCNQAYQVGSYLDVRPAIYNHKLGYNLVQVMEKK